MTIEETKKYLPYIQAFAEGKTIQMQVITNNGSKIIWEDVEDPNFHLGHIYRVKPESKYRPFETREECWNEMLKHEPFGWVTDGDINYCISIIDNSIIMVGDYDEYTWSRSYEHALKAFKFIDGQPFGFKIDETDK